MAFKKILVPLDGSDKSKQVLDSVVELARRFEGSLVLMAATLDGTSDDTAGKKALEYLESQADQIKAGGLEVACTTAVGLPAEMILKVASERGADLIAMATHRESAIARGIIGSVTDNVLRNSPIPVLAINPDSELATNGEISSVIVPLDGSELAEKSIPVALEIAKACDAEVLFVQAIHAPSFAVTGPGGEFYGADYLMPGKQEMLRSTWRSSWKWPKHWVQKQVHMWRSATQPLASSKTAIRFPAR